MIEQVGDLWEHPAQYRCVTTNGIRNAAGALVMGAGVALAAKRQYPALPHKLGHWVEQYGNRPFICQQEGIITFPTKHNWRDLSDIKLICQSAKLVVELVDKFNIKSVAMTRVGCGNGGLTWDFVKPYIEDILDDRFVVLHVQ